MDMNNFYQRFVDVSFDKNGVLKTFVPNYPENFNFGYDVVDAIAAEEPNRRAMIWCDSDGNEREFTYAEMKYYSDKTANMFLRHGIKKGDAVMLVLRRHYEFWFSIVALHKIGAVVVPASFLLTKKDYVYRFESAGIKAVVCSSVGEIAEQVDLACKEYEGIACKFLVDKGEGKREGWMDFTEEMEASDDKLERVSTLASDPMLMYFSSGTTGYPKMVLHDYTYPIGHIITAKFWHNVDPEGIHLTYSDTGWGKSVWGKLYGQWTCGTTVFVYDHTKFAPSDLLHMIEKYRITTFCAPPTIYRFFIKEGMENYDLSSLKYATTAGEALNPEVFNRFKEYTGLSLMEGFGQTESTLLTANLVGTTPKPGSMGKPTPLYDIDIVDDDGKSVEPGTVGEVVVRTKGDRDVGVFVEYYRNPEKTYEAHHDGLYHTGDTAWMDEDGYLWYVGRTDDVIKASGYRIGPFEIESVLMEHPAVLECAVTGAPDPIRGTVVKATIVLTKTYTGSPELVKELQDYVKKQTAPYKYPRIVEFVDELPKTISGKIMRKDLRAKDGQKS